MFCLVCFENDELHICRSKNVVGKNGQLSARYKSRGSFRAKYVTYGDSYEDLEHLKNNINNKTPYVAISEEARLLAEDHVGNSPIRIDVNMNNDVDSSYLQTSQSCSYLTDTDFTGGSYGSDTCDNSHQITYEQNNDSGQSLEHANSYDFDSSYEKVNTELIVDGSKKTKRYFCLYCQKMPTKLVRHFVTLHKLEEDVKKFSALPKGCKERRDIIEILRKKGSFMYNTNKNFNSGDMIVSRRPSTTRNGGLYKACPRCRGFFSRTTLRRHYVKCAKKAVKGERNILVQSRKIQGLIHPRASDVLRKEVFPILREDYIVRLIRYDELLILYGNKLCIKYKSKYHHKMIRAKLRLLGRLLYAMKQADERITDFSSIYSPEYYDVFVEAVNKLGELSADGTKYNRPAVASTVGTAIKSVARVFISECIKQKNDDAKKFAMLGETIPILIWMTQRIH